MKRASFFREIYGVINNWKIKGLLCDDAANCKMPRGSFAPKKSNSTVVQLIFRDTASAAAKVDVCSSKRSSIFEQIPQKEN